MVLLKRGKTFRATVLLALSILVSGCSYTLNGRDVLTGARAYQYIKSPSMSRAGLNESFTNCLRDMLDPMNRGSGC